MITGMTPTTKQHRPGTPPLKAWRYFLIFAASVSTRPNCHHSRTATPVKEDEAFGTLRRIAVPLTLSCAVGAASFLLARMAGPPEFVVQGADQVAHLDIIIVDYGWGTIAETSLTDHCF